MYYTIHLNFKDRVIEGILPADNAERYSFNISALTGRKNCFISFEKEADKWRIVSDDNIIVTGSDTVEDGSCTEIEVKSTVVTGAVFVSELNEKTSLCERYCFQESITIGTSDISDIVANGDYISRKHAEIRQSREGLIIRNFSRNGIYVNGHRVSDEKLLDLFDTVWIYGLKLTVTGDSIAVQDNIFFKGCSLRSADTLYESEYGRNTCVPASVELICNSESALTEKLEIQPFVSETIQKTGNGYADVVKPSLFSGAAMAAVSVLAGSFTFPAAAAVFAGTTAAVSGVWITARGISERNADISRDSDRKKYISTNSEIIKAAQEKYRKAMKAKYPDALTAAGLYTGRKQKITGRNDDDFLVFRICTGEGDFSSCFDFSRGYGPETRELAELFSTVSDVPLTVDLKQEKLFFAKGSQNTVFSFIAALAVKISAFCNTGDVRMMLLSDEVSFEKLRFMRMLPHTFSDDRKVRFCSDSEESRSHILSEITEITERRKFQSTDDTFFPYYIVFCTDYSWLTENNTIRNYIRCESDRGIIFIVTDVSEDDALSFTGRRGNSIITENPDVINFENASSYSRLRAADSAGEKGISALPESLSFMEMYRNTETDCADIALNYSKNKASCGIRSLVGTGNDGRPFYLDIHENVHGPHGLIAGTTGSGKSEFIITFILSLALFYSPEQVAFVLIDYKGGGMSGTFEDLPHTAGILTNLADGTEETGRILVSLSSEIKRRQVIFRKYSVSHIDSYMKLYENGNADEAVPHLVIICDEFAELKREQPEFISQLVSISRVGRSLGVHLILATQRPSGVVDDEIKSNSGFRICLKVQDRSDSYEMTGIPDAAELRTAGRAFVQTSSESVPVLIQSGYSGAVKSENEETGAAVMVGADLAPLNNTVKESSTEKITQLDYLKKRIVSCCRENNIASARRLWSEPLKSLIYLSEVSGYGTTDFGRGLIAAAGVTDDPENQTVYPSEFNLYESGNIIIAGAAGSGKTTFANTVICSLAENYSPERFRFSVVDFTGGMFSVFEKFPHCDTFVQSPDDNEIRSLLDGISSETEARKRKFAEVYASDYSEYLEISNDLNAVLICMDGYGYFREIYPVYDEIFARLAGDAAKYGIYFMITVKQVSDMRMRTRQNFRTAVTFELSDKSEYAEFLGVRPSSAGIISKPGRGYLVSDRRVLVFQSAAAFTGKGIEKHRKLLEFAEKINSRYAVSGCKGKFCRFINSSDYHDFLAEPEKYIQSEKLFIWSEKYIDKFPDADIFTGVDGASELLFRLKDEFSQRNTVRKISGEYRGEEITVFISGMDGFCSCIYSDGNEDMAGITEKFLTGGAGLGISFVSVREENPLNTGRAVYRIFSKNSIGGVVC